MTLAISGSNRPLKESLGQSAKQFDVGDLKFYPILRKGENPIDTNTLIERTGAFGGKIGLAHGRRIIANQKQLPIEVNLAGQPRLLSDFFIVLPRSAMLVKGVRNMAILICRKGTWEIIPRRLDCRWPDFFLMACP